ncbi:hypothetical protein J6590_079779 [Homalodisca vitripennis]|nr:hypothetical protein J6590_079779 [Homalodisca vitripennis]
MDRRVVASHARMALIKRIGTVLRVTGRSHLLPPALPPYGTADCGERNERYAELRRLVERTSSDLYPLRHRHC